MKVDNFKIGQTVKVTLHKNEWVDEFVQDCSQPVKIIDVDPDRIKVQGENDWWWIHVHDKLTVSQHPSRIAQLQQQLTKGETK